MREEGRGIKMKKFREYIEKAYDYPAGGMTG